VSDQNPEYILTQVEAYDSMRAFLQAYWERGLRESDEIACLLGQLAPLRDGISADPAHWEDWLAAVRIVKDRKGDRDFLTFVNPMG
jgi:hypothetical protein